MSSAEHGFRIWGFAFGYFASYVPYTLLTKSVTSGVAVEPALSGTALLPLSTAVSVVGMLVFLTAMGWWGHARQFRLFGLALPRPRLATFLSGVATTAIVLTTTLAYTFDGISVLFAMLLMRGGVLMLAPIVDKVTGRSFRSIPWWSWAGSGLALVALVVGFAKDGGAVLTIAAGIDILIYLAAYFFRLRWMSRLAKTAASPEDARKNRIAYFVEEQMVATPLALIGLAVLAFTMPEAAAGAPPSFGDELRYGFVGIWDVTESLVYVILIGIGSQGAGVFGALILLEPQENAFTVPVNRASSVLAGLVSSYLAMGIFNAKSPSVHEIVGAGIIIVAIVILSYPSFAKKRA
ncbi:MAG: hypothetical protein IT385_22195 [Deltaproteobacteria bacterium]|nr:hypothetical protein [Deltaproteobacteria bacterium]